MKPTIESLAEQLGGTRAQLAEALNKIDLIVRCTPALRFQLEEQERAAIVQRLKLVKTLADYKTLTSKERDHFHTTGGGGVARLVAMLGAAKSSADKALRAIILDRLSFNMRAIVVHQLAPAPKLVRVDPLATFMTSRQKLRTGYAESLRAAGVPVKAEKHYRQEPGSSLSRALDTEYTHTLSAFRAYQGGTQYLPAGTWAAWVDADPELAKALKAGCITVETLDEQTARDQACREFIQRSAEAFEEQRQSVPTLPALD